MQSQLQRNFAVLLLKYAEKAGFFAPPPASPATVIEAFGDNANSNFPPAMPSTQLCDFEKPLNSLGLEGQALSQIPVTKTDQNPTFDQVPQFIQSRCLRIDFTHISK
jgi:hypothetical protein